MCLLQLFGIVLRKEQRLSTFNSYNRLIWVIFFKKWTFAEVDLNQLMIA